MQKCATAKCNSGPGTAEARLAAALLSAAGPTYGLAPAHTAAQRGSPECSGHRAAGRQGSGSRRAPSRYVTQMLTMLQQPGLDTKQCAFLATCIFQYGLDIGSPQQEERALSNATCMEEAYDLLAERLARRADAALPEGSRCGPSQQAALQLWCSSWPYVPLACSCDARHGRMSLWLLHKCHSCTWWSWPVSPTLVNGVSSFQRLLKAASTCLKAGWATALARRALATTSAADRRVVVAIAGVPGSGKSTTSREVCRRLNAAGDRAVVVPMDGARLRLASTGVG